MADSCRGRSVSSSSTWPSGTCVCSRRAAASSRWSSSPSPLSQRWPPSSGTWPRAPRVENCGLVDVHVHTVRVRRVYILVKKHFSRWHLTLRHSSNSAPRLRIYDVRGTRDKKETQIAIVLCRPTDRHIQSSTPITHPLITCRTGVSVVHQSYNKSQRTRCEVPVVGVCSAAPSEPSRVARPKSDRGRATHQ